MPKIFQYLSYSLSGPILISNPLRVFCMVNDKGNTSRDLGGEAGLYCIVLDRVQDIIPIA